jgi:DNA-binding response OmpR family regulator
MTQTKHRAASKSSKEDIPFLLLIDDDQMVLDILNEVLQSTKVSIITAHSGEEALAVFKQYRKKIKLVLLDLFLPDISGIEIFKQIMETRSDLKVIFMSGFPDQDILKLKELPGEFDYIQKPFSLREIKSKVQSIIN